MLGNQNAEPDASSGCVVCPNGKVRYASPRLGRNPRARGGRKQARDLLIRAWDQEGEDDTCLLRLFFPCFFFKSCGPPLL